MRELSRGCRLGGAMLVCILAGCTKGPETHRKGASAEPEVRAAFAQLQAHIQAHHADKLWAMLSRKSHADAEAVAKKLRDAYEKGGLGDKKKLEETLGLSSMELAKVTGLGFLASKRFRDRYGEIAQSKVAKVTTEVDTATVYWDDPDGEREKTLFLHEDGQWKAWLTMPKGKEP